jgi:hypothetical protein
MNDTSMETHNPIFNLLIKHIHHNKRPPPLTESRSLPPVHHVIYDTIYPSRPKGKIAHSRTMYKEGITSNNRGPQNIWKRNK